MPKRGRNGESLTGGTGDVNPQTMIVPILGQPGTNDTFAIAATPLPIPRYPQQSGKQIVMELLRAKCMLTGVNITVAGVPGLQNIYYAALTTNPTINPATQPITQFVDPRVVCDWCFSIQAITGAGFAEVPTEVDVDLTDSAGHGILIATDNIYSVVGTLNTGFHGLFSAWRMEYRFKEVTLAEYVGIVQAQQ